MRPSEETCQLLGPASLFVQFLMGISALGLLLFKRNREHPRRKLDVWLFDIGKQVIGALGIHFINVGISVIKRHKQNKRIIYNSDNDDDGTEDQCDWYFLNLLLDTTIGIPILWLALNALTKLLQYFKVRNVESGNYFPEETENRNYSDKPLLSAFVKQLCVFIGGLVIMKIFIYLILNYFEDFAYWFADLILAWADPWPDVQIILVMFIFPVLLNCFQYFCVDNVIKLHLDNINSCNSKNFEDSDSTYDELAGLIRNSRCTHNPYQSSEYSS
ncbi:Uncharacterized protein RNJ44_04104 [Nakaseomyces bracarensis]|uniref:Vacuolar membrane protein n=1 Tax=Nakaseomyces bracarensis TaxID=273131 RepID=A0ABR4NU24_9SACH